MQDAFELLSARRYKHVEQLLQERQEAAQRSGQMAMVVILAAAYQLCLTCRQFQADRKLHQLGLEEATHRERESRRQIRAVLTMVSQLTSLETEVEVKTASDLPSTRSEPARPEETESDKQPTLIQKVKQLLGFEPTAPVHKSKVGVDSEYEEPRASPHDQKELATPLHYLAQELEMLEKRDASPIEEEGRSEANDKPLMRENLPTATSESESSASEGEKSLLSPEDEPPPAKARQAPVLDVAVDDIPGESPEHRTALATLPLDQDGEELMPDEEPIPDDGQPDLRAAEQPRPVLSPKMSHDRPANAGTYEDLSSPSLVVHCLGPFQMYSDNKPIERWPSNKGKSIFKYLVNNRERPVAKEVLMDLFWPEADPDSARNNLNVAIYGLRQAFRNGDTDFSHVLYQNEHYLLNPELQIWLDVEEFMTRFQNGQRLWREGHVIEAVREFHAAEALYQGEFLEEDRYEEWLMPLRQQLTGNYLELLERLSQYYFDKEEYTSCITICRSMLSIDTCLEETHCRLMCCHYRQGQQHLSLRQYHQCVRALKEELEVAPGPKTEELYEKIRHHEAI